MKLARVILAVLAIGLFVEPIIVQQNDVAIAATKKKKNGYTKAQRAEIHKRALVACRKKYHGTSQVNVNYKANGQISITCWTN